MASEVRYVCQNCQTETLRWSGKCESCGEWNTFQKVAASGSKNKIKSLRTALTKPVLFSEVKISNQSRLKTGINELDQVLGGGFVPGSVTLLSGDPGIGKSTLVLQFLNNLGKNRGVLYVSGEESAEQVKMRAERLNTRNKILFAAETDVESIVALIEEQKPELAVIDSIQTLSFSQANSSRGSLVQVRECSAILIEAAKKLKIAVVLIGHVTKEGMLAGPKALEHLVDVVLYLEGDRYHSLRVLRGIKNRFGSTNETGVFEMSDAGLTEVLNPSALFLAERQENSTGSVVTPILEGNRAFLLEVQALTTRTNFGYPKRTASGFDQRRLELLIAVLVKRANLKLEDQDVYLNVVGGFKIREPAADTAVCLAIASSLLNKPIDPLLFALGEVGLAGEIRGVAQIEKRLAEGEKLGFKAAVTPRNSAVDFPGENISAATINEAILRVVR